MSWTLHTSKGAAEASGSATSIAVTAVAVSAGDLVVVNVKWEGGDTTVSVSDGTTTLTPATVSNLSNGSGADPFGNAFYLMGSVASGSLTYTATFGAARTWRNIMVQVWTPSAGSISLDGTPAGTGGTTANPTSPSITTTGTDGIAFGYHAGFGNAVSAQKINGVAAAQNVTVAGSNSNLWALTYSAGFTGTASETMTAQDWACGVIAFNLTAGGGGSPTVKTLAALGAG